MELLWEAGAFPLPVLDQLAGHPRKTKDCWVHGTGIGNVGGLKELKLWSWMSWSRESLRKETRSQQDRTLGNTIFMGWAEKKPAEESEKNDQERER